MRDLNAAVDTEVAKPITQPGYFVALAFDAEVRICSRGDLEWRGATWLGHACQISGLTLDGSPAQSGTLTLGDADGTFAALILNEGVANRAVQIWSFYGEAPAPTDPVMVFSGVLDGYNIDLERGTVGFGLEQAEALFAPRGYINAASGFHFLPANGTKIAWNGELYTLERGGS